METVKHKVAYDFKSQTEFVVCDALASINKFSTRGVTYNYNLVTCKQCLSLRGKSYKILKEEAEIKVNEFKNKKVGK